MTDAVHAVDRAQAIYNLRMMRDIVSTSVAPRRTNTTLITLFAGIALALSAFGVYAVVSYSVARRAREFGIRVALGATGRDIASLVGLEMALIVAIGLVVGMGGAWMLSRVMASLVFRMDVHDVATFVAEAALAAPRNDVAEIAGPERAPFNEIVARYLKAVGDPRPVVRDPEARYYGGRVEERSLVPLGEARLGRIGLDEWLRRSKAGA